MKLNISLISLYYTVFKLIQVVIHTGIRQSAEVSNQMVSVERVLEFTKQIVPEDEMGSKNRKYK